VTEESGTYNLSSLGVGRGERHNNKVSYRVLVTDWQTKSWTSPHFSQTLNLVWVFGVVMTTPV
jgi:hypothetical protein